MFMIEYNHGDAKWIEETDDVGELGKIIERVSKRPSDGEKAQEIGRLMENGDEFRSASYKFKRQQGRMILG